MTKASFLLMKTHYPLKEREKQSEAWWHGYSEDVTDISIYLQQVTQSSNGAPRTMDQLGLEVMLPWEIERLQGLR